MDASALKKWMIAVLLSSALGLATGCTSPEARQVSARASGSDQASPEEGEFQASLILSRKISRKSGRPIGEGDSFRSRSKSSVHATLECAGARPRRPYTFHLVWVNPDGKELYRKYATVVQEPASEQEFRTVITWLDAEDLHKVKVDTVLSDQPVFNLQTRFNTSLKRERDPGTWEMRVYLDRRHLLTRAFELTVPAPDSPDVETASS